VLLLGVPGVDQAKKLTVVNVSRFQQNANDRFIGQLYRSQIDHADFHYLNRQEPCSTASDGLLKLLGSSESVLGIEGALTGCGKPGSIDPQTKLAAELGDLFESRTFRFENPVSVDELTVWLQAVLLVAERVKGHLWIRDPNERDYAITVNLSKGDEKIRYKPSILEKSGGSLVAIYRMGIELPSSLQLDAKS
jgi:G3E family GTPase